MTFSVQWHHGISSECFLLLRKIFNDLESTLLSELVHKVSSFSQEMLSSCEGSSDILADIVTLTVLSNEDSKRISSMKRTGTLSKPVEKSEFASSPDI